MERYDKFRVFAIDKTLFLSVDYEGKEYIFDEDGDVILQPLYGERIVINDNQLKARFIMLVKNKVYAKKEDLEIEYMKVRLSLIPHPTVDETHEKAERMLELDKYIWNILAI